jgi:acylphosphatase
LSQEELARRYIIRGRVQGVGFRYFAHHAANAAGVSGYVRNLDDGNVEVYAIGSKDQLSELAGLLWKGPRYADVRGVEEKEAVLERCSGFQVRH